MSNDSDTPSQSAEGHYNPVDDERDAAGLLSLSYLFKANSRARMIDWILTDADPDKWYYKAEMARKADVARNSITRNIDVLVEFGLLKTTGEKRIRYAPNPESPSWQILRDANLVLEDVHQQIADDSE